MSFLSKIFADQNERELKKLWPRVERVNALEPEISKLSNEQLAEKTKELRSRLNPPTGGSASLDSLLEEAFACVREAARRTLGQRHFDVQILGGIVLHQGKIAEMKTGEGKTLASTAPVYLNALEGKGVHIVTVNDYLARRDTVWMGQIYHFLGLSVGCIVHDNAFVYDPEYKVQDEQNSKRDESRDELGVFKVEDSYLRPVSRREAYAADITYGTNNEFGFDYLRDNMAHSPEQKSQRGFHYAIIDEIDSILIDEARTPLIISAPDEESTELYKTFARIVPRLREGEDYNVDEKMRAVSITEQGIEKVEKALGLKNIYDPSEAGIRYAHNLEQALRAQVLFTRDKDYVVRGGEVIIVDEFTGRLMPGRRYSEGLHQAIEAKEGVAVQKESRTLATITFQNLFRMYSKLSGMTGTARTSAEEFEKVYDLEVVSVPTNRPMIRDDKSDLVFRSQKGKYQAAVREIKTRHEKGQPLLVGTTSIEKNEYLSRLLQREGIPHELLNAKNHEKEGEIIAQAGRLGRVTVATNMAGRGVDIILGGNPPSPAEAEQVRSAGGLHVIGTERHEARRIDNQLRGRAGRQGDSGSSQFFVSLEDDLMRVFGGERVRSMMQTLRIPEDQPIESRLISGAIESAQKKIEGFNFDTRKHVLDYDQVLNRQRETIYRRRNAILYAKPEEQKNILWGVVSSVTRRIVSFHTQGERWQDWNLEEIFENMRSIAPIGDDVHKQLRDFCKEYAAKGPDILREELQQFAEKILGRLYQEKEERLGPEQMREIEKWVLLRTIDTMWMDHLDAMEYMRDSVRLRAYGQRDPLVEYKREGIRMFNELLGGIDDRIAQTIFKIELQETPSRDVRRPTSNISAPSKAGRNDPCPCGSGKKFKKCHGA